MTTKTLQVIALALAGTIETAKGRAQQPLSQRPQIKQPASASDYLKVATYFRYREVEFRVKAQNAIKAYLVHSGPYPMATKTVTRAQVAARQVNEYSCKAEENARLAASYDEKLLKLGYEPPIVSKVVVSAKDLQEAAGEN